MLDKLLTKVFKSRQNSVDSLECEIPNCPKPKYSGGYCTLHYQRDRSLSSAGITKSTDFVEWYAAMHKWRNASRSGPDGAPLECNSVDCSHSVYARGLCNKCYQRERRKKMNER